MKAVASDKPAHMYSDKSSHLWQAFEEVKETVQALKEAIAEAGKHMS